MVCNSAYLSEDCILVGILVGSCFMQGWCCHVFDASGIAYRGVQGCTGVYRGVLGVAMYLTLVVYPVHPCTPLYLLPCI